MIVELFLWSGRALLSLAFFASGAMKVVRSRGQLLALPPMAWAKDFTSAQVKMIGLAEVAGAAGLVLPGLLRVAPALSWLAAYALGLLMAGAIATHVRRRESPVPAAVLGVVCVALATALLVRL